MQEKLHEEYLKYRDECDARKLLISDINELRYQQEDYQASKQPTSDNGEEKAEDPVLLKVALRLVAALSQSNDIIYFLLGKGAQRFWGNAEKDAKKP